MTTGESLSREQAEAMQAEILAAFDQAWRLFGEFCERRGWKALGFRSRDEWAEQALGLDASTVKRRAKAAQWTEKLEAAVVAAGGSCAPQTQPLPYRVAQAVGSWPSATVPAVVEAVQGGATLGDAARLVAKNLEARGNRSARATRVPPEHIRWVDDMLAMASDPKRKDRAEIGLAVLRYLVDWLADPREIGGCGGPLYKPLFAVVRRHTEEAQAAFKAKADKAEAAVAAKAAVPLPEPAVVVVPDFVPEGWGDDGLAMA